MIFVFGVVIGIPIPHQSQWRFPTFSDRTTGTVPIKTGYSCSISRNKKDCDSIRYSLRSHELNAKAAASETEGIHKFAKKVDDDRTHSLTEFSRWHWICFIPRTVFECDWIHSNDWKDTLKSSPGDTQPNVQKEHDETGACLTLSDPAMDRLHFLDMMDEIYIQQPFRSGEWCLQNCLCWEVKNRYEAFSVNKETKDATSIFSLIEESSCLSRQRCPSANRPFTLNAVMSGAYDDEQMTIFSLVRPYRCGCFCCSPTMCIGRSYMEVYVGERCIGTVQEDCVLCNCKVNFSVYDSENRRLCGLQRFCCVCDCVKTGFDITIEGEKTDRKITKTFGGLVKELFTTNDNYVVEFPKQFRSRESKVLLIAASMLLEYRYFENNQDSNSWERKVNPTDLYVVKRWQAISEFRVEVQVIPWHWFGVDR